MSLAILSTPDTHGVNVRAHGDALAKWAIARVARSLPRRAQKALLFELCILPSVIL
jgi:hypothetical protein